MTSRDDHSPSSVVEGWSVGFKDVLRLVGCHIDYHEGGMDCCNLAPDTAEHGIY
jgi:hypothetical protein